MTYYNSWESRISYPAAFLVTQCCYRDISTNPSNMKLIWRWFAWQVFLVDETMLIIVSDSHYRKPLTCCKKDLNLCRICVQTLLNKVDHGLTIFYSFLIFMLIWIYVKHNVWKFLNFQFLVGVNALFRKG